MAHQRFADRSWIVAQLALCVVAAFVLVGWPPRSGALMLVPLDAAAAARIVPMALAGDARLIGRGPLPGSYVVRGERSTLLTPMLAVGILTLAAPAAGCASAST